MFTVRIEPSTLKAIDELQLETRQRVLEKIRELKLFPNTRLDIKKMQGGQDAFRLRVGKYRAIFAVYWKEKEIIVFDFDIRGRIYD